MIPAAAAGALNATWRRLGSHCAARAFASSATDEIHRGRRRCISITGPSGGADHHHQLSESAEELYGKDLASSSTVEGDARDLYMAKSSIGENSEGADAAKSSAYRKLTALETPRLLVHRYALLQNIEVLARTLMEERLTHVAVRPHTKAHKCSKIAQLQLNQDLNSNFPPPHVCFSGVACQKVSEAEAIANRVDVNNILISNEVVCETKIRRLANLSHLHGIAVSTVVDHAVQIHLLQAVAEEEGIEIGVLVDVNVGQNRCGVDTPEEALELAKLISAAPSLKFNGIQAYHGAAQHIPNWEDKAKVIKGVAEKALAVKTYLKEQGNLSCKVVTGGGTGSFVLEAKSGVFTEVQPGSYIFNDVAYSQIENAAEFDHSLFVLSTVISRNDIARRCVLDAGMKAISFDSGPPEVYSLLPMSGDVIHLGSTARPFRSHNISAICGGDEHTILDFSKEDSVPMPQIGSKVMLIPGHCDPTVNLYDNITVVHKGEAKDVWRITGRGPGL